MITVVIPAKNEEARIGACIKAIRDGNRDEDIEIIVVDNGSWDKTVSITESLGCVVLVVPDVSVGALRNRGVAIAKGDVIAFIDADCISGEGWLMNASRLLRESDDIGLVTGFIRISDNPTWVEKIWGLNRVTKVEQTEKMWASSMNMVLKASVFREMSGFNGKLPSGEDVDFCARLRNKGYKILYDRNICVIHMGEAKTLGHLVRKERWRGLGTLDRFIFHPELRTLIIDICPSALVVTSLLLTLLFISMGKIGPSLVSFFLLISVPILRTILVSLKIRTPIHVPTLLIVWSVYYYARTLSLYDSLKTRIVIFSMCAPRKPNGASQKK